jgi:uncharacterized protein YciI
MPASPERAPAKFSGVYLALLYDLVDDYLERRGAFRDEHLGLAREAHARGELVLAGAWADPADGALLVWKTDDRSVVEAFVNADPYVRNGLVTSWRIREWTVVVGND